MGRTNYEGYHAYWPQVAGDSEAVGRDRDLATWLDTVEKVVFSRRWRRRPGRTRVSHVTSRRRWVR